MMEHYRDNADVIGWQTDNELNTSASTSYSESTRREFQQYLEAKYLNIDALNHAWGGDFWATGYHNFDQVVILRQGNPGWFIFHNLGRLDGIDFRGQFSADLPDGIETTLRVGNGQQLLFVLNTTDTATQVAGLPRGVDLLGAALNNGSIELEADGCAIIELER